MEYKSPITLCFPFAGDVIGGSHISVLGLVQTLDPKIFRSLIVPQIPDGEIATLFRDHGLNTETGIDWTQLPFNAPLKFRNFLGVVSDIPSLIRFLRQRKVDIVHTNDGRTHATWALAARLSGARLLWHHRGDPTALGLRFAAPLLANRVATVSQFSLPPRGLYSAARKAEVVHSPFDTNISEDRDASRAAIVKELGCEPNTQLIAYVGSFVSRKRPFLFIDTIAEILKRRPTEPVIGLIFGKDNEGTTEQSLADYARIAGVSHCIKFMGYRKQGVFWLAGCDILLVPAVREPFGRTLIEAFLVGTPVVATASGGNIEALREGDLGLLVPPEDKFALASGCLRFRDDQAFSRLIVERAWIDARSRFGLETHANLITAMYDQMLRGKRFVQNMAAP
jgi:glycosyltransferase involved in cell wall biosynthesis